MQPSIGVCVPTILLPKEGVSYESWAVIACDQFTQDRSYWDSVRATVADQPSTLDIVLPEIDLASHQSMVPAIHANMERFAKEILTKSIQGMVLTRRTTSAMCRKGVVLAVDLEQYDYTSGSVSLIRATEGTIVDRLPPRMKIRQGATLESPHILLLIDDPDATVIEPLFERFSSFAPLYDFTLMMQGGHIEGRAMTDPLDIQTFIDALSHLLDPQVQMAKYGSLAQTAPLLFAVGDGNHSLATAKACWEQLKRTLPQEQAEDHPARYALVEVGNLHDQELQFAPIHRVLFHVDAQHALSSFAHWLKEHSADKGPEQTYHFTGEQGDSEIYCASAPHRLVVGSVQRWLDEYLLANPSVEVDYIHGDVEAQRLGRQAGNLAILLPAIQKQQLFLSVMQDGALPRKTFSMGHATDKRYYLECRRIALQN